MMLKIIGYSISVIFIAGLTVLSTPKTDQNEVKNSIDHIGYVKPGAAVELSHDYDGKTRIGDIENINITLNHIYTEGYLTVSLITPPEIQIRSDNSAQHIELEPNSVFTFPIQFSSVVDGTHYLSVEIVYESPFGDQMRRIFSIPVSLGHVKHEKSLKTKLEEKQVSSRGIISLPAIEVIR